MMRVVIMGAHGMLGQALVRAFRDADVIALDRGDYDITERTAVVQKTLLQYFGRSTKILQKDFSSYILINAAAYNDVDGAEKHANLANRVNGDAVGYLAQAAAKVGAMFVHYSTDYVFDGTKKEGYREDDEPNPISAYGKSKLLGEQKIQNSEFRIQNYYLIRTSRLFGKQGNGKQSFVDLMIAHARMQDTIEVIDEEFSSPTYVEDLAQRTREIIEQKQPSGIYHVTNSEACTWYEFAQEIFQQNVEVGQVVKPVPSSHFPRPAKRPAYSQLLNTKLPPLRSWQEALTAYLSSIKK